MLGVQLLRGLGAFRGLRWSHLPFSELVGLPRFKIVANFFSFTSGQNLLGAFRVKLTGKAFIFLILLALSLPFLCIEDALGRVEAFAQLRVLLCELVEQLCVCFAYWSRRLR